MHDPYVLAIAPTSTLLISFVLTGPSGAREPPQLFIKMPVPFLVINFLLPAHLVDYQGGRGFSKSNSKPQEENSHLWPGIINKITLLYNIPKS